MSTSSTQHWATKYEMTKMIGMRLEQIARGAPPLIDVQPGMTVRDIVMREVEERKMPFKIRRTLPNGDKITMHARDLDFPVHY